MNIDERIEALTQSLELLSLMHRDNEKKDEERERRNEERMARLGAMNAQMGVLLERLNNGGL